MVFAESWGKVGGFLQKLAILKKGLSRFCPGFFAMKQKILSFGCWIPVGSGPTRQVEWKKINSREKTQVGKLARRRESLWRSGEG